MKIMVVDDHTVVRRGLMEILEEAYPDVEFGEAASAPEALQQARRGHWDVVILDITLPRGSGLEVLKDLKIVCPDVPVLVLTMHPEGEYALRALKAGAAGYLTKETAPEKLVEAVRKALAGGRYVSDTLAEDLAFRLRAGVGDVPRHETLSDREYQVMRMIGAGQTVSQIAEELSLSVKTISTYRTRIMEKMGMQTNAELMRYAMQEDLVD